MSNYSLLRIFVLLYVLTSLSSARIFAQDKATADLHKTKSERKLSNFDIEKLNFVEHAIKKGEKGYTAVYEKLIRSAESAMDKGPFSVMQKTQLPPSGDKHDYLSLGPYWWPDKNQPKGLPWVRRDGEVNPLTRGNNVDEPVKRRFFHTLETLTWAYFFSENIRYAKKIKTLLNTWFLDPSTRMNPNLNYAQGIPGRSKGRSFGIIESIAFLEAIDAVEVLKINGQLSGKMEQGMRSWISDFLHWLQTSSIGLKENVRPNNHGTWYDVQVVGMLLFLHREGEAAKHLEKTTKARIASQITAEGKEPHELKRTKSLSYSTMNLSAFTKLAFYGRQVGVNLWDYDSPEGGSIKKAYAFLRPYALGNKKWPFEQLGDLEKTLNRLRRLYGRAGSIFGDENFCKVAAKDENNRISLQYPCVDFKD